VTCRPYPNAARALSQLDRHVVRAELPGWRVKLAVDARRALDHAEATLAPVWANLGATRHAA
jgi:hypothetical protein